MNAPKEPHSFPFSAQRRFRIPVRSDGYLIITRAKTKDKQFFVFLANKSAPTSFLAPRILSPCTAFFCFRGFLTMSFLYSAPQFVHNFARNSVFLYVYILFFSIMLTNCGQLCGFLWTTPRYPQTFTPQICLRTSKRLSRKKLSTFSRQLSTIIPQINIILPFFTISARHIRNFYQQFYEHLFTTRRQYGINEFCATWPAYSLPQENPRPFYGRGQARKQKH